MQTKKWIYRLLKIITWIMLSLVGILIILVILLQLPAVQDWLTHRAETTLSEMLQTKVEVAKINLLVPSLIGVEGVQVDTPAGDSLVYVQALSANIDMWALLDQRVIVDRIAVKGLRANIVISDSTSNFQFIIDAFAAQDSTTVETSPPAANGSNWEIALSDTQLDLEEIDLFYVDKPGGVLLDGRIGRADIIAEEVDLEEFIFLLDQIDIEDTQLKLRLNTAVKAPDKAASNSKLTAGFTDLRLVEVALGVVLDSQIVMAEVENLTASELRFQQAETLSLSLGELTGQLSQAAYHQREIITSSHFDPAHVALAKLALEVQALNYNNDSLSLQLPQLEVQDQAGNWQLTHLNTSLDFWPGYLGLTDFQLNTARSALQIPKLAYEFPEQIDQAWKSLRVQARGKIQLAEWTYFLPNLKTQDFYLAHPSARLQIDVDAFTEGELLEIDNLALYGPGLQLQTTGSLSNPLQLEALTADLQIKELDVRPLEFVSLLPPGLLPTYIVWPARLAASGQFFYSQKQLTLDFAAREERAPTIPWSLIELSGQVTDLNTYPATQVEVQVDTLLVSRASLLAYTPEDLLPAGYNWPQSLRVEASVDGSLNKLELDVQLSLPNTNTQLAVMGRIDHLLDQEIPTFDLRIPDLQLQYQDIAPLLPDSLLPPMIAWPSLQIRRASVQGTADSFHFELPIYTSNGNWQLAGNYQYNSIETTVKIEDIRAAEFFKGPLRDSLLALELEPLDITARLEGQIVPRLNTQLEATLVERNRGELLDVQASISDTAYFVNAAFDHPDFQGAALVNYRTPDTMALLDGELRLEKLDLFRWGLSNQSLLASGNIDWSTTGLTTEYLDGYLRLDDVLLRGNGNTAYTDSLLLQAKLLHGDNEVNFSGDVLDGYVRGRFDLTAIGPELVRFITAYTKATPFAGDAVVNGHNLAVHLNIKNPRPFTTGLVPGLTKLEPLTFALRYRDETPELKMDLEIPSLVFAGLAAANIQFSARGDEKRLNFQSNFGDITYGPEVQVGPTRITGESSVNGLEVALAVGPADSLRYRLAATYLSGTLFNNLSLAPEQLINRKLWRAPRTNEISWNTDSLQVSTWELRRGRQSLQLASKPEELLITFQHFSLGQWAKLLNPTQTLLSGSVNGEVVIEDPFTSPAVRSDLRIDSLGVYGQSQGNLEVAITQPTSRAYLVDATLGGEWHDLQLAGQYLPSKGLDLTLAAQQINLAQLTPFLQPYVAEPVGNVQGDLAISGALSQPQFKGALMFSEVALTPTLLGSRWLIDQQSIQFTGDEIIIENFAIQDKTDAAFVMNGKVMLRTLTNPSFDLQARARNFLAVNSNASDNDLFYGYLRVNADLAVSGNLLQPRVVVTAEPTGNSKLTYAYTSVSGPSMQQNKGVVTFAETYEWAEILANAQGVDTTTTAQQGAYIETNLNINPSLLTKVIVDPLTQQAFSGRGEGAITFIQYPNGSEQLTGAVVLNSGNYNMVLEGLRRYTFEIAEGSKVSFTGDPTNPQLDLTITNQVQTSPLPLVEAFVPESTTGRLSRRQTFRVALELTGDLLGMDIAADILYPEEIYGNQNFPAVEEALSRLRRDPSSLYTAAITLVTFKNFVFPRVESNNNSQQGIVNGVAGAVGDALSNLLNDQLGFVDVDLGVDSYETAAGEANYNLRLSLQKTFLNDRLIVSVDGVANTATDTDGNESGSYLDNVSVAYLIDPEGQLKIKLFNDRDQNVFVGGNVIRFGGRLVFSKDFDHFFWEKKN